MRSPIRHRPTLIAALFGCLLLLPVAATAQVLTTIPPGEDCWHTPCGMTHSTFCDLPIPPSFFDPGSLPFDGIVLLGGPTGQDTDTRVRRFQPLILDGPPETIPIEIVALNLVSCQPITVTYPTGTQQWDVTVGLSVVPSPQPGQMTVTKTHPNGGTFDSVLPIRPRFTFTEVGNPGNVRVLDTGLLNFPPDFLIGKDAPWVHQLAPGAGFTPCGVNFVPGVEQSLKGHDAGSQCCVPVCHSGATATHCVVVSVDCSRCRPGACCNRGRCRVLRPGHASSAGERCTLHGGSYGGDGTDCRDSDGDGLADIMENNNCCGPKDACHSGTNPQNPDTDGDGTNDGNEQDAGTDPCDPASHP